MSYASALARVASIQAQFAAYAPPSTAPPSTTATDAQNQSFQTVLGSTLGDAPAPPALASATGTAPTTGDADLGEPTAYDAQIVQAAQEAGVSPALVKAVVRAESNFDPNAVSPVGATGLMQLMPGTAAGLGVDNPLDPLQNLRGGAKYLRGLLDRFGGDVSKALAGYNAGPGAVEKYGGIPPYAETQAYVPRVLGYLQEYGGLAGTSGGTPTPDPAPLALDGIDAANIPAGYALVPLSALGLSSSTGASAIVPASAVATTTTPAAGSSPERGAQAVRLAAEHLGTPYRWGGESPDTGFDCSGLMQYTYRQLGISIPRVSQEQFKSGLQVPRDQLQPGDLVFFQKNGDVHHVGMYVGDNKFIQAPHTGDVVKISSLSEPYYASQYCGARRYA